MTRATGQIPAPVDAGDLPFPPAPIEELLRLFVKAVRAHQLYLHNNPVYRSAVDAVRAAFPPIWERTDELPLAFAETEIRWLGFPVMAEPTKSADSLPWTFFKDGIREVRLTPGFETDELARLLEILQRARKASPEEDDLLTMLWEADFSNLRYRYVDLGAEPVAPLDATAGAEAPAAPEAVRTAVRADASQPTGVVSLQDFDATLHFLDEAEFDYLRREVAREYADDLRRNVLAILLDIYETQPIDAVRTEVGDQIETMMLLMLAAGELRSVAYLLSEVGVAVSRGREVTPTQRERLGHLPDRLSAAEPLGQLLLALDEAADQPPASELAALFGELRPAALATIFAWLPRLRNPSVRAIVETAVERLASAHPGELIALIQSPSEAVAREAIGRAAAMKIAAAVPAMARALADAAPATRLHLVQALAVIGSPGALQALERCIEDGDRDVRLAAVKAFGRGHRGVLGRLEQKVKGRALRDADLTERMAFFEAYGALCGDAGVPFLDGLLNGKGVFGRREDAELRACAAIALGRVGGPAARAALERSAGEKDIVVRNAVNRALRGGAE